MSIAGQTAFALIAATVLGLASTASAAGSLAKGFPILKQSDTLFGASSAGLIRRWVIRRGGAAAAEIQIVAVLVPAKRSRVTVLPVNRQGAGRALFEAAGCPPQAVVINGGFYLRDERGPRSLGLLRSNGRTLSQPSGRRFGGFLTSEGAGVKVARRTDRDAALRAKYAVESSPIAVEHGRSGINTDDGERFDRIGIGATRSGATVVVAAFGEDQDTLTLSEFARVAIGAISALGERPDDLIAMDGGPSTHLYHAASRTFFGSRGGAYLPNAICVEVR